MKAHKLIFAARLMLRGKIPESRFDAFVALAEERPGRFPESLADLVQRYDAIGAELADMHIDARAFGLSDWRAACMEGCAQNAGDARDAIAAYCARFNVADPIEARA